MADLENKTTASNRIRNQPVKEVSINLCDSFTSEERIQGLQEALQRKKLLREDYIYSAFHPSKLEDVLTKGTARTGSAIDGFIASGYCNNNDSDSIFYITVSNSESSMRFDNDEEHTIVSYLEQRVENDVGYIAIYKKEDFIDDTQRAVGQEDIRRYSSGSSCSFIDPENKLQSLVAVVKVLL
jgi:hypothetical protein